MYHGDVTRGMKEQIERDLRDEDGHFRLVIVSSALGRGANFPCIQRLIFLRAPLSLEGTVLVFKRYKSRFLTKYPVVLFCADVDLWQVAGRAGRRTTDLALITVYWSPADVRKNVAAPAMIRWLNLQAHHPLDRPPSPPLPPAQTCRRACAVAYFTFKGDPAYTSPAEPHFCCDLCRAACSCCVSGHCPPLVGLQLAAGSPGEGNPRFHLLMIVPFDYPHGVFPVPLSRSATPPPTVCVLDVSKRRCPRRARQQL